MTYEYEGKTEKEAIEMAANELGLEKDQFDVEILEVQKNSLFKKGYVKIRVHTEEAVSSHEDAEFDGHISKPSSGIFANPVPQDDFEKQLVEFVETVIKKMGYEAKVEIMFRESHKLGIKLSSSYSSILIGKKGKNLDALQLLANVYAGHLGKADVRVILDTENYRMRREETLVRLAYNTADKVRLSRKSILLEDRKSTRLNSSH